MDTILSILSGGTSGACLMWLLRGWISERPNHVTAGAMRGYGVPQIAWAHERRMTSAHDVGRAINPQGCEGQIEGAAAMGLGGAFLEELIVGAKGELRNPAFLDYRLPTALDVPPVTPIIVEEPHAEGPYGAKGLGELALAATSACLSNAIFAGTGLRMNQLPINTERVLAAVREQRGGEGRQSKVDAGA